MRCRAGNPVSEDREPVGRDAGDVVEPQPPAGLLDGQVAGGIGQNSQAAAVSFAARQAGCAANPRSRR